MKLLIISDIHGNDIGLKAVLDHARHVDKILCAGDITGYYPFVNEVIDLIKKKNIIAIKGNHDKYLLDGFAPVYANKLVKESVERMKKIVTRENIEFISSLSNPSELSIGGKSVFVCHGSPWNLYEEYVYPDYKDFYKFASLPYDVIIYGHTHRSVIKKIGKVTVVNPGSCGQPRDYNLLSYTIWDTNTNVFKNVRIEWDMEGFIQKAKSVGTPQDVLRVFERQKQ